MQRDFTFRRYFTCLPYVLNLKIPWSVFFSLTPNPPVCSSISLMFTFGPNSSYTTASLCGSGPGYSSGTWLDFHTPTFTIFLVW